MNKKSTLENKLNTLLFLWDYTKEQAKYSFSNRDEYLAFCETIDNTIEEQLPDWIIANINK